MIRVAVTGAKGRMGSTVVSAVTDAPDMEVVALFDAGDEITQQSVNGAQVAVDFSIPSVTESNVHALLDAGVDVVVGTTGWTEESYARVREHAEAAGRAVLIAP
ncbi:MAG: 4-hydroxy-tetrahydrodipicolinate reductase, partial [Actinomyces sp.]|nr:4-hydroxy-tetrahydrodipicolinate reductase [Actinomyces sp.]